MSSPGPKGPGPREDTSTPGAVHFQQSLSILDEHGTRIRYELDPDGSKLKRVR
jgi:hypothetical protein